MNINVVMNTNELIEEEIVTDCPVLQTGRFFKAGISIYTGRVFL